MDRFWVPKCSQNRSKIGLKSDHEANAKILKNTGRGGVFEDAGGRKSIKNRLKNDLMLRCQNNNPKMSEKLSNMAPKFVPSWDHVGLQNRPGRVQGRKKRTPEAIRKEDQKKHQKTSVWEVPRREVRGGVRGNWAAFGPHYNLLSTLAPIQQDLKTLRLQASKLLKGLYCTEASKTST